MKVGFICQPFDYINPSQPPGGSIALLTFELARQLSQSNQVAVCAPLGGGEAKSELWNGIQFHRLGLRADAWLLDRPRRLHDKLDSSRKDLDSILYCPIYASRAAFKLREENCDIIHIHNFSQFVPIARRFNPRTKIVLHMNCDWLAQFDRDLIDRRLRHADMIIGCAEFITNHVKERFPHYALRCDTLYNGASVAEFSSPPSAKGNGKRFIFAGRVSPEKGLHVLMEAFKIVVAREPEAELVIAGGAYIPPISFIVDLSSDPVVRDLRRFYATDYMEYLRNQAKAIADRVTFTGFINHKDLASLLRQADIFVQPSVWGEPFPLSVIEAMTAELPVIASRTGGLPEAVMNHKTGLLVEPNSPAALADAMLRLIDDREKARQMGSNGAARASDLFSWEAVAGKLTSLYKSLTSGVPAARLSIISSDPAIKCSESAASAG
jgi:glycosyltransferase involved in cell wall biosynthesis